MMTGEINETGFLKNRIGRTAKPDGQKSLKVLLNLLRIPNLKKSLITDRMKQGGYTLGELLGRHFGAEGWTCGQDAAISSAFVYTIDSSAIGNSPHIK